MKGWKKCSTRRQFNKVNRSNELEFRPAGTMWGQPVQGAFRNGRIVGHLIEGTLVLYAKDYNARKFKEVM